MRGEMDWKCALAETAIKCGKLVREVDALHKELALCDAAVVRMRKERDEAEAWAKDQGRRTEGLLAKVESLEERDCRKNWTIIKSGLDLVGVRRIVANTLGIKVRGRAVDAVNMLACAYEEVSRRLAGAEEELRDKRDRALQFLGHRPSARLH